MAHPNGRDSALRCPRTPQRGVPTTTKKLPIRKQLPHDFPLWVDPYKADFFITICWKQRGRNQLALPSVADELFETIEHRNKEGVWYAHIALLMPDHVHFLLSFPETEKRMQTILSKWKEWTAKTLKIEWQRDFFEHRLRKEESFREKADYILLNPVRAGLAENAEDWPYVFIAEPW
jgi:putative transposase